MLQNPKANHTYLQWSEPLGDSITTFLRFPGLLNADLPKMDVNMVPFPYPHFFMPSFAPKQPALWVLMVPELIQQIIHAKNTMIACDLHMAIIYCSHMSMKEVDKQMLNIWNKNRSFLLNGSPTI